MRQGKSLCTSKWSTEAAAHPDRTADCQDVCVTVWILLIQRGGRGDSIDTREKQHIDEEYLLQYTVHVFYLFPDISLPDKLLRRRT